MSQESQSRFTLENLGWTLFGLFVVSLFLLGAFRVLFVDFVDNYQVGYKYDKRNGSLTVLGEKGYIVTPPFVVNVHTIDLRPQTICLSSNPRVLNCKLVEFDLKGLPLFLSWHGRDDYEGGVTSDANGHTTGIGCTTGFCNILRGYAYDDKHNYSFLRILKDDDSGTGTKIEVTK